MRRRQLGRSGLTVSELALGTWAFGGDEWGPADDARAAATIEAALASGVTLVDTADVYGYGHSEELVGSVLAAPRRLEDLDIEALVPEEAFVTGDDQRQIVHRIHHR